MRQRRLYQGTTTLASLAPTPAATMATINGTDGNDRLAGGGKGDTIFGLEGNDYLVGKGGDDYLDGGAGDDHLIDQRNENTLIGGAGDDYVYTNFTSTADGGEGFDDLKIRYAPVSQVDFIVKDDGTIESSYGSFSKFEKFDISLAGGNCRIVLGDGDDILSLGGANNSIRTAGGDDMIRVAGDSGLDVNAGLGYDRLAIGVTIGTSSNTFDDAAFFADTTNHIVGVEVLDVYALGSGNVNNTVFTLSTGANFTIYASNYTSGGQGSIKIDASAFTHGVEISDSGGAIFNAVRTITFEQTVIIGQQGTSLSVIGSAYDDRIAYDGYNSSGAADGGGGIDTLVFEVFGSIDIGLRDGKIAGIKADIKNIEAIDARAGAGSAIHGGAYADTLAINDLRTAASILEGRGGDDHLTGGLGNDLLIGGSGDDVLAGGEGADVFLVRGVFELKGGGDVIADFSHAQEDRIDVSALDPSRRDGDQAFTYIGDGAFSGDRQVSELRATTISDGVYLVEGDRNHDGSADFSFTVHADQSLAVSDFVL